MGKPAITDAEIGALPQAVTLTEHDRDTLDRGLNLGASWYPEFSELARKLVAANDGNLALLAATVAVDPILPLAAEVAAELAKAIENHPPMHSPHEGWSVILEELEELRTHVRADTGTGPEARKEALQVAAMGLRYALDLCAAEAVKEAV